MSNPPIKAVINSLFKIDYDPYDAKDITGDDLPRTKPVFEKLPDQSFVKVKGIKQLMMCMHSSTERAFLSPKGIDMTEDLEQAVMAFVGPEMKEIVQPFFDKKIQHTADISDWNEWMNSLDSKSTQLEFISMVRHMNQKIAVDYIMAFLSLYLISAGIKNGKDLYDHYRYIKSLIPLTCKPDDISQESFIYFARHSDIGPQKIVVDQFGC